MYDLMSKEMKGWLFFGVEVKCNVVIVGGVEEECSRFVDYKREN